MTTENKKDAAEPLRCESIIPLGVGNRDGDAFAVKASNGKCYLVLEADTLYNEEVFSGMGSTESTEISNAAFSALANTQSTPPSRHP